MVFSAPKHKFLVKLSLQSDSIERQPEIEGHYKNL